MIRYLRKLRLRNKYLCQLRLLKQFQKVVLAEADKAPSISAFVLALDRFFISKYQQISKILKPSDFTLIEEEKANSDS